jgi:RsiW-degrading membrane proteinase PrsW (M82 family)/phage FluMu protein Com
MSISIACPGCEKVLNAPDSMAGRKARCPNCKEVVAIPGTAASSPTKPRAATEPKQPSKQASQANSSQPSQTEIEKTKRASRPDPTKTAAKSDARRQRPVGGESLSERRSGLQRFAYLLFGVTLLPLVFSLLGGPGDVQQRFERTLDESPQATERIELRIDSGEDLTWHDILAELPGGRVEGAHLSMNSWVHWLYALLSAAMFFGLIVALFPLVETKASHMLVVGLITATCGIFSLLMFQWIAAWTDGWFVTGGNIIILIPFYIIKFIGFSYSAAMDPSNNFWLSFLGFTCGVGFCEEFVKVIPVAGHFRGDGEMRWRGACLWGLASGVGFGVAEGIIYSSGTYNGLFGGGIYVVRFVSCVGLHAVWSGAAAISMYRRREMIQHDQDWSDFLTSMIVVLWALILLHGLYDTLLKRELNAWALLVALLSFGWLAFVIEKSRREEASVENPKRVLATYS